jgi:hypothetical protein
LCHLADAEEPPPAHLSGLIHIEIGLQRFQPEPCCPKCSSFAIQAIFHPLIVMSVGVGQHPCSAWYGQGILTGNVSEHLCLRCTRCGYGWPTHTADTYLPPMEEPEDEPR